jgi:hypothetical protein
LPQIRILIHDSHPHPDQLRPSALLLFWREPRVSPRPAAPLKGEVGIVRSSRKSDLNKMTVGRTEKPMPGKTPKKPRPVDGKGDRPPAGQAAPAQASEQRERSAVSAKDNDPGPLRRAKPGAGSYEDPAEEARRKRRPGKTGKPGR